MNRQKDQRPANAKLRELRGLLLSETVQSASQHTWKLNLSFMMHNHVFTVLTILTYSEFLYLQWI